MPFDWKIIEWLGLSGDWRIATFDANAIFVGLIGGVIGLAASEAAYMAEIARAGILSVDTGQMEAAQALGMSRGKAMRRIVLPQAMRVIVPPTGNETIAMLKDTSLLHRHSGHAPSSSSSCRASARGPSRSSRSWSRPRSTT